MLVLGVSRLHNWCMIVEEGRAHTCRTKDINGELYFRLKKVWYPVAKYAFEYTEELIREGEQVLIRVFQR